METKTCKLGQRTIHCNDEHKYKPGDGLFVSVKRRRKCKKKQKCKLGGDAAQR